ncbi:MAG: hypothetical protein J0L63_20430 [Anaerolineae bacterium]|nr:hypothetical protein [Anaerolineae bacterium]
MATKTVDLERGQSKSEAVVEVSAADRAMGASMIASGIGSLVLGIAIVLAEVNADIKTFLTWNTGVGPLSGKTGVSIIAFVISWVILHYAFQRKAISLTTSFVVTLVLVVLGLLLTFPPVFMSFGG